MASLRCLYVDLDSTLLGKDASLLHDGEGRFSLLGARALEACDRAGVEVMIYSGRRQSTLFHDARMMGISCYAFEAGAGVVLDGEVHWLTGDLVPRDGKTIFDQIEESGAPKLLLEHYAGRLEYHDPWHRNRDVSHLFRGDIDAFEADALLEEAGLGHMRVRGYAREDCFAIGDSREDLGAAAVVRRFWLVANGVERDPTITEAVTANTRICEERNGAGVYEAVITELSERRA